MFAGLLLPVFAACPPAVDSVDPRDAGGSGGGAGGAAPRGCDEAPALLVAHCGGPQCHRPDTDPPGLDLLTPAGLETRLIGKAAKIPCTSGESILVNTSRPASGVLFERVGGTTCFRQMPPLDSPNPRPPANFVDCLKQWVEAKL